MFPLRMAMRGHALFPKHFASPQLIRIPSINRLPSLHVLDRSIRSERGKRFDFTPSRTIARTSLSIIPPNSRYTHSSKPPSREDIYTIPNFLTASRLALCPVIYYSITMTQYPVALAWLSLASLTDFLDGWIARRWQMHTYLGSVLDPFADKVLMTTLVCALGSCGLLSGKTNDEWPTCFQFRWPS